MADVQDQNQHKQSEPAKSLSVTWLDDKSLITPIRNEIWRLTEHASSMETAHWYAALDDCFENDEFIYEDASNMRWRLMVLKDKDEPVGILIQLIDEMLPFEVKYMFQKELERQNGVSDLVASDRSSQEESGEAATHRGSHTACQPQLNKYGGQTNCCRCFPHEGCTL